MAKKPKPTREELERDQMAEGFNETLETVYAKRNAIGWGIMGLVVICVAAWVFISLSQSREQRLNENLALKMSQYAQLDSIPDMKARVDAAKKLSGELDSAIGEFGTGSKLARQFVFLKGLTHYAVDEFPQAQEAYTQYIKLADDREERARGGIALAYAMENQAFFPTTGTQTRVSMLNDALKQYQQAKTDADNVNPYLYYYAMLGEARVNEVLGQNDKAIALYRSIIEKRPAETTGAKASEAEGEDSNQQRFVDILRQMLNEREGQLSFAATANLRLERLQARAGLAPATTTSVTTTTTPASR